MDALDPRNWPTLLQAACSVWMLCLMIVIPIIKHDLDEISRGNNSDDHRN